MNTHPLAREVARLVLGLAMLCLANGIAHAAVGRTESAYGVTQNGAATYTIPVRATEGINGITPHLAISYVGPGSRSIFGVGFALSGISYITPCRKTIAQDLGAAPVTLTSADRYCLDGARLRLVTSTDTYGAPNVKYRTELDQMVRVTSLASTNNVPGWFRVEMPNGLEYEYGNSSTSKLMSSAQGGATPQFWAVSKITDPYGNSIVFTYDTDAALQRFRPSVISYTERGGSGHYKVSFVYQTTAQLAPLYYFTPSQIGGAAHKEDKLLDRIELKHDDVTYRAYKFTYLAGAGNNKRLASVQDCAYAPSEDCLPATTFAWQSAMSGHNALASTSKAVAAGVIPLDINGDGIEDLAWASGGTWRYMLGGAAGFGAIVNTTVAATNPTKAMPLEWNGDGFWDLLIDWSDGKWRVMKGGASGFNTTVVQAGPGGIPSTASGYSATVADVDADGRDDLLTMQLNSSLQLNARLNGASGFGAITSMFSTPLIHTENKGYIPANGTSSIRRPDFNGDGRFDLLVYACIWDDEVGGCLNTYRWMQLMSNGTSFVNEGAITGAGYNIDVRFGDFNADGLADIAYPSTTGTWNIGFGQGDGGLSIVSGPSSAGHATYQSLVGDYDGDGFDDLYVTKNSPFQWEIFRSTGTALSTTPNSTSISGSGLGWMLTDQNGDSLPDIGRYASGTFIWSLGTHQGLPAERLLTATDGLSNAITFSYLPMTSATVYTKGTGAAFPVRDFKGSAPLVRTMQVSPGGGTSYTFTYKYADARIHSQGRSFLGMGKREITDGRNNVFTTETYRQDFPYIGAQATRTVKQSSAGNAKIIQDITNTYFHHVLASFAGGERFLPYRNGATTKIYEVSGIKNGNQITEIIEGATVNTLGNTTLATILIDDKDSGSPEFGFRWTTQINTTYSEDQTNWCIAVPTSRSETRILPDQTSATRDASWQLSGAECRVTQETLEPGAGSALSLVTDVGRDACGNIDLLSSYPSGLPAQTRETTLNYGSRCQRPETITNPEDHAVTLAYNWPLALPATQTDPNGLVSSFEYDGFGRLTHLLRPDGSPTGTGVRYALTACTSGNGWCGKNSSARVKVTRTERSTTDTVLRTDEQFIDGIGRLRWSHSDSLESGPSIVETLYDTFNRPTTRTQPYFTGGSVYSTALVYDLIGRVTSINAPISETVTSGRITGYAYEGRDLKITDPQNFMTSRRSNVLGQLRAIFDPSPGGTTSYAYHPFGELASITDAAAIGNVTSWNINDRGLITGNSDPDSGSWTYELNAFGETTKIRDAKTTAPAWTTQFTFDKLSRPLTRQETEGTTTFVWGTSAHNTASNKYIGHLKSVASPGGYSETYTFDQYARFYVHRTTIEGVNYDFTQQYWGSTGMPSVLTYPNSTGSRLKVISSHANQMLKRVSEYQGTTVYWEATSTDAFGHVQDEAFGNGVATYSDFDQASGLMASREGGVGGGTGLIDSIAKWDDLRGNLTERQDLKLSPAVTEAFVDDSISRLDVSTRNGSQNLDVNYDAIGNITSKGGQTYVYTGAQTGCSYQSYSQPRAVRKIGSTVYCYDANGNMTKRGGSTISYASYNLPTVINSGSNSSTLSYGAFRNRFKQVAITSAGTETTLYVAGLFERVTRPSGVIEYRHYVPGSQETATIHTRRSSGVNSTYYWHADHLASPELFTDQTGAGLVRPSFGAFGERRDGTDWNGAPSAADLTAIGNITPRGFTGHEHLDAVGLIHMHGRVYDPGAGRFLSADPILTLGLSQDVNPYNYAWNNPLNVTDPSGQTDVVINCIDACGYYPGHPGPLFPEPYDPPAGAVIDNPALAAGWIASNRWSGDRSFSGRPITMYGVGQSTVGGTGQAIVNATVPGAYYGGQAELAFREGRYLIGATFSVAALADAALGVLTLGRSTALNSTIRTAAAARGAAAATRGTSVLGHYPAYLEKAAELGARRFNIPPEIWARMSPAERLTANGKFLDRLITRGDEVLLTTPVGRATAGSSLEWEINYLLGRGYQVVDDGWRLIPGP